MDKFIEIKTVDDYKKAIQNKCKRLDGIQLEHKTF